MFNKVSSTEDQNFLQKVFEYSVGICKLFTPPKSELSAEKRNGTGEQNFHEKDGIENPTLLFQVQGFHRRMSCKDGVLFTNY
jgi:hypothetical protein